MTLAVVLPLYPCAGVVLNLRQESRALAQTVAALFGTSRPAVLFLTCL